MKEAFEKMTGMPDAWTNPALMVSRNAFIQGWEAALAQPAQEPMAWMDIDEKGSASGLRYWSEPNNRHEVALYRLKEKT
jgi:hypothetical protein